MEKIEKAFAVIILRQPWWSVILLNLKVVYTPSVALLATDGGTLFVNLESISGIPENDLYPLIMHQLFHIVLLHPFRIGNFDKYKFNYAADLAVNALLDYAGFPTFGDVGDIYLTTEEIYNTLPDGDYYTSDDLIASNSDSAETNEESVKNLITSAGDAPNYLNRLIDSLSPKISWQTVIRHFFYARKKNDAHTWSRFSRRIANNPAKKRKVTTLLLAIDTSGSIDDSILSNFLSEITTIKRLTDTHVIIISCDASIHQVILPNNPIPSTFIGGGGTDFRPIFEFALKKQIDGIIYFTDGDGIFPLKSQIPTLWVLTQLHDVTFGEKIILNAC